MTAEVLERFRALARSFREAVESGDLEAMDRILSERRGLLAGVEDRGPAPTAGEDAYTALREILEFDRESEAVLRRQREALRAELVELHAGRRGLEGYRAGHSRAAKWIDERG